MTATAWTWMGASLVAGVDPAGTTGEAPALGPNDA